MKIQGDFEQDIQDEQDWQTIKILSILYILFESIIGIKIHKNFLGSKRQVECG